MKRIKIFAVLTIVLILTACSGEKKKNEQSLDQAISKIEVMDFHSTHRCMTCNAIEKNTKYTLSTYFSKELEENNEKNKDLDFTKRANFKKNGASPFSIALKVKDYNIEKIPFEKVKYHQEWMDENSSIYSAKNSKKHIKEPSIFVIYPEIESDTFQTLADLINIPDEYAFAREFYKHPNGAQKVSKIIITSSNLNLNTETIKAVNGIENLTVKSGKEHVMEVHFDNDIQKKSFDLRPELPLIIYL